MMEEGIVGLAEGIEVFLGVDVVENAVWAENIVHMLEGCMMRWWMVNSMVQVWVVEGMPCGGIGTLGAGCRLALGAFSLALPPYMRNF